MAKPRQQETLRSIATSLGVSKTTVSNAYNHPEQLSPELREKILTTARIMGYPGPHPTARSLKTRRTGTVGVLLTEHLTYAFEDLASVDFLAGMAAATTDHAQALTLLPVGPDTGDDLSAATVTLNTTAVDGFVIYSVAADDPFVLVMDKQRVPAVICDQPKTMSSLPFVGIDDFAAIAPAAQALVDAGHTRIGILCIRLDRAKNDGPVTNQRLARAGHHVQRDRIRGALAVFEAAGLDPSRIPVIERHINDGETTYQAAEEMLTRHPEVTAICCTTDSMALGVLHYCADHNITVPDELSVTGFDGIATALLQKVTTVIQPNKKKGKAAGTLLFSSLFEPPADQPARIMLPTTFIPGETVGPPLH